MIIRKFIWIFIGILVIMAWLLGFIIEAQAETMKCKVARVVTKVETMPVGDEEGHILMMLISEGLAFFENGDIANFKSPAVADRMTGKVSQSIGYTFFTFEDGSSIIGRFQFSSIADQSGKMSTKSVGEIIKGTGRYQGITGTFSSTGKAFYLKGEADKYSADVTITYTLPPK